MLNIFSPLEQFEPIPYLAIFFGGVDFSITNVTVIFCYIFIVFSFLIDGYLFQKSSRNIIVFNNRTNLPEDRWYSILPDYFLNDPFFFYTNFNVKEISYTNLNGVNLYLTYLKDVYKTEALVIQEKKSWLGSGYYSDDFDPIKLDSSREYNRVLYNFLRNNTQAVNYSFNNIELFQNNFLNNFYIYSTLKNETSVNFKSWFTDMVEKRKSSNNLFPVHLIGSFNLYVFENIYNVILGMVKENIGGNSKQAIKFFPFIFSLFVFILISNLIGLIPYSSTVTSYLIVTFALAMIVLLGVNIIAGKLHGLTYFGHFLPAGCPFPLYPLIIPIEAISYTFRIVSLSVRLFANMMAGHTLLAVLAGFGWTMVNASVSLCFLHPLPIFVVFVLVFLETGVAIIQAYVFAILSCMYLDEAINLH